MISLSELQASKAKHIIQKILELRSKIYFGCAYAHKLNKDVFFPTDITYSYHTDQYYITFYAQFNHDCTLIVNYETFIQEFVKI